MVQDGTIIGEEDLCDDVVLHAAHVSSLMSLRPNCVVAESTLVGHSNSPESSHGSLSGHSQLEKRHICEICGKGFPYLSILESHKRCHTGEKPFNCHFCDKKFAQKATLQVHERTHTGERPYKCKYCEKTFAQYGTKTVHEKSAHLGIRNYKCPKCSKCLSSPSALYTHKKTHGEKTFQCGFCPKTFTLKNYLKLHVKQVHEQTERKHICHFCSKSFAYAGSLQVHVRTHTGERPYVCKYCPKAFASQGNLQSHERTHTGERPYTCCQCGRSFIQKSQLSAHEATHQFQPGVTTILPLLLTSPEPPPKKTSEYVCKFCGKRYAYASSLYVHTRLHTGERPFRCSFCDKAFTNQGNMQVHQRVHTGEKPYKCTACDKSYAQKVGLKIHLEQCQLYLGNQVASASEDDVNNSLDLFLPKMFNLTETKPPVNTSSGSVQMPPSPPSIKDLPSPSSLGFKVQMPPQSSQQQSQQQLQQQQQIQHQQQPQQQQPQQQQLRQQQLQQQVQQQQIQQQQLQQRQQLQQHQQQLIGYGVSGTSIPNGKGMNVDVSNGLDQKPSAGAIALQKQQNMDATDPASTSAFHGVKPDPYSKVLHEAFDAQVSAIKNILDTGFTNTLISQQVLLQNQQLQQIQQLLMQPSEQWGNLLSSQQVSQSSNNSNSASQNQVPQFPITSASVNSLNSVTNSQPLMQPPPAFATTSVKQEPPMLV